MRYISLVSRFSQSDIHETANAMVLRLFSKIPIANTPEKIAENDYLMKCKLSLPIVLDRKSVV